MIVYNLSLFECLEAVTKIGHNPFFLLDDYIILTNSKTAGVQVYSINNKMLYIC